MHATVHVDADPECFPLCSGCLKMQYVRSVVVVGLWNSGCRSGEAYIADCTNNYQTDDQSVEVLLGRGFLSSVNKTIAL